MALIEATFVQGDTGPTIRAQITDEVTGDPINLTNCTVKFQMRKPDDTRYQVNAGATITNASQGLVAYSWGQKDLAIWGEYDAQWEITFQDAVVQTTTPANRINVRRQ
jgi:hypothetical protein